MTDHQDIFAVFAVARPRRIHDLICATTRGDGKIGLPGGKVDAGEDIFSACEREAKEEGWNLDVSKRVLHIGIVDGKKVAWVHAVTRLRPIIQDHKEKSRGIMPIAVPQEMLSSTFLPDHLR